MRFQQSSMRTLTVLSLATALLVACTREVILPGERFPVRAPLEASIPVEGQTLARRGPGRG